MGQIDFLSFFLYVVSNTLHTAWSAFLKKERLKYFYSKYQLSTLENTITEVWKASFLTITNLFQTSDTFLPRRYFNSLKKSKAIPKHNEPKKGMAGQVCFTGFSSLQEDNSKMDMFVLYFFQLNVGKELSTSGGW